MVIGIIYEIIKQTNLLGEKKEISIPWWLSKGVWNLNA